MIEIAAYGRRVDPPEARLPGRYKERRRSGGVPVQAECPCGWKSKPLYAAKAERAYLRHLRQAHPREDLRTV